MPEHVALGHLRQRYAPSRPSSINPLTRVAEPPSGQLRFAVPATVNFTANLLGAIAKMFPSKLFSTGGDELNTNCYVNDTETQTILKQNNETFDQALSKFTVGTHAVLEAQGKTPVVWEGAFAACAQARDAALTLPQRWCSRTTSRSARRRSCSCGSRPTTSRPSPSRATGSCTRRRTTSTLTAAPAAGSATSPRATAGASRSRRGSARTRSTRPQT
jgi:hypothetical protein